VGIVINKCLPARKAEKERQRDAEPMCFRDKKWNDEEFGFHLGAKPWELGHGWEVVAE